MSNNTEIIDKMETQLNLWDAQIKLLEMKIESAGSKFKLKHAAELNQLHTKQRAAVEKLNEMERTTSETWDQVKETADIVWDDLKAGIAKAHSNIK